MLLAGQIIVGRIGVEVIIYREIGCYGVAGEIDGAHRDRVESRCQGDNATLEIIGCEFQQIGVVKPPRNRSSLIGEKAGGIADVKGHAAQLHLVKALHMEHRLRNIV